MDSNSTVSTSTPDYTGGSLDSSILSGSSPSSSPVSGPSAPAQPSTPDYTQPVSTGPLSTPQPSAPPDYTQQSVQSLPTPTAPQAAGQPSVWKNLVMGAIAGLAGSAGAKHFGAGAAGGAAGYLEQKQQQTVNAQNKQQLQFESVQAADQHIKALNEARRADQLDEDDKLDYKQKSADYQAFLQDNFGIEPNLSFNDSHTEAIAALTTGANANGGKIPPVATVQQPSPDGGHGTIAAYSPTQNQMQTNANGFRSLINQQRRVQGLPDIDSATFNSLGFKGQRDAAQAAIEFLKPTPPFSLDKTKPDYLPVVLAQRQQALQTYQAHKDPMNGDPDANPAVVSQLQAGIDYLKSAWDSSNAMENKQLTDQTTATENAKAATPQGKATLAKTQADTAKAQFEADQEKREAAQIGQPDPTGFSSQLTSKEYDKRYDSFTKSKDYQTLQTLQGSYQQFQSVKADLDAGKDMTGAQSVVGLFNAIGISATPLAGKGMRINQNTIEEHVGARGVDQAAYQKLLSLKNGDVITPQQLRDYSTIATQVYRDSYVNAVDEAHRQGLPADFLPKGGGRSVDSPTAEIYSRSVLHTNPQLANNPAALKGTIKTALQSNGWQVQ